MVIVWDATRRQPAQRAGDLGGGVLHVGHLGGPGRLVNVPATCTVILGMV
jgi:hypothetical protein